MDKATWAQGTDEAGVDATSGVAFDLISHLMRGGAVRGAQPPAARSSDAHARELLARFMAGLDEWLLAELLSELPSRHACTGIASPAAVEDELPIVRFAEDLPSGSARFRLAAQWVNATVDLTGCCWLSAWLPSHDASRWRDLSIRVSARREDALAAYLAFRAARSVPLLVHADGDLTCSFSELSRLSGNEAASFLDLAAEAVARARLRATLA